MNREIKYRIFIENVFVYWGYIGGEWVNPPETISAELLNKSQQYIGLEDKKDKEIYDGDILIVHPGFGCEWEAFKSKIKYEYFLGSFAVNRDGYIFYPVECPLEIIGNIYENPELLEETNK